LRPPKQKPTVKTEPAGLAEPLDGSPYIGLDVAWAVYRFVPLYDDATCERLGYPIRSRSARLRIFCDAYQLDAPETLLPTVCQRIRALYDTAHSWGEAGRPGWREVWRETSGEQWLSGLRYVEAMRCEWERELVGG
jgi:hypothetical protein